MSSNMSIEETPDVNRLYSAPVLKNKVFGIGLSKTGTTSLCSALNHLGYRALHYPPLPDLRTLLRTHDAAVDTSIACCFEELDSEYPNSTFVYTTRAIDDWIESARQEFEGRSVLEPWKREVRMRLYGSHDWEPGLFRQAYFRHQERVQEYFKSKRESLLVVDVVASPKWETLCSFLNIESPSIPFPHLNSSSAQHETVRANERKVQN